MLRTVIAFVVWSSACDSVYAANETDAAGIEFFEKDVRPLLVERCQGCHGDKPRPKGGLQLTSRPALMRGGDSGPAAVAGKPEESLLVHAVRYHDEPRMPPKKRLSEKEIGTLTRWVELGLPWPASEGPPKPPRTSLANDGSGASIPAAQCGFWSFQKVVDRPPPEVEQRDWVLGPIDRFVLDQLERHGLRPAGPANRRTLIRRATFDLTGLPPGPEDVEAFLVDGSADAFDRVVDRLLASPHYGERLGRLWLDLAHYADTAGETADFPVPEAYRYRNYVVDAFNQGMPYDAFLREQLAGDILAEDDPGTRYSERIVATGFLASARRFGFDPQNYYHLTIEDTIDTVGKSLLGLTVACARCHDHKFDPVSSADYYALYGIFASTRYPFPGSEETKRPSGLVPMRPRAELEKTKARLAALDERIRENDPEKLKLEKVRAALAATMPPIELAYAVAEGKPADARIQRRGDPKNPGVEVPRRFLTILGGQRVQSGSGRRELAEWVADPANPLTARVLVNRIWQHHFGRGIVATPSNFGKQGQPPTHPELLDWLAARFVEDGWSIKRLHRRIMLARVYQLASEADSDSMERDPENLWRSHANRRRLDAEAIRDALLFVGGSLDSSPGGTHPFPPVSAWGFTQHNPFQAVYETNRRSIYLMTQRTRRHPFLAMFDGPDPNTSTDRRNTTTVPTQALFFLNNPLVHSQAEKFAERLLDHVGDDRNRVDLAHRLAFGRRATSEEQTQAEAFLIDIRTDPSHAGSPPVERERSAWAALARVLFSSNEFIYID